MRSITKRQGSLLACALLATACGDDAAESQGGEGELRVAVYGEAFIEEGIPADAVSDGWAVSFDAFEVEIRDVFVAGEPLDVPDTVDLSEPSKEQGQLLTSVQVPAGKYSAARFTIARVHVVGSASKGQESKVFDWTFDKPVAYSECEATTEVEADGVASFQITVHADHFLYDSLVSTEPTVAFQALADADADSDGAITKAELESRDLGAFDPGNDDEIDDLWSWLEALSATLGHVDGEGHCLAQPEEA